MRTDAEEIIRTQVSQVSSFASFKFQVSSFICLNSLTPEKVEQQAKLKFMINFLFVQKEVFNLVVKHDE